MKATKNLIGKSVKNPDVTNKSPNKIGKIKDLVNYDFGVVWYTIEFRDFIEVWSPYRTKKYLI